MSDIKTYPRVLSIAGSDSGGGAGIQADIKAISATGSYAATAITAVTIQNTMGVEGVFPVPPDVVARQVECVINDIGVDAVKIGMLHSSEIVEAVAAVLNRTLWKDGECKECRNIVLDPVMVSTSGHILMEDSAQYALVNVLMPLARVITPNLPEAEVLLGRKIKGYDDMKRAAHELSFGGRVSVMLKAGHLNEEMLNDVFYNAEENHIIELSSERIDTLNTHGTGCTLSSAFASYLAQGYGLDEAAGLAKKYIIGAIKSGKNYKIGHGCGPVNHFFEKC